MTKVPICAIRLRLQDELAQTQAFYSGVLGLVAQNQSGGGIEFGCLGNSPSATLYHFAFNISENKIDAARDWLAERVALIATPPEFRDPAHAPEVRWFKNWNAHALYFLDPAGNVVEFIARHDLPSAADGPFTPADILGISEIALAADDTLALANWIHDVTGFEPYRNQSETFRPMGDERGMFVIFKTGTELIGGITAEPVPVKVTIRGDNPGIYRADTCPLEIQIVPSAFE